MRDGMTHPLTIVELALRAASEVHGTLGTEQWTIVLLCADSALWSSKAPSSRGLLLKPLCTSLSDSSARHVLIGSATSPSEVLYSVHLLSCATLLRAHRLPIL